jgi:prepilin-type N-terminal cleavage/methylation domain-containing protein
MKRNQSGFTLIEIAIVLVIIGLLLGGVMKGQELINSAKVKNLAADFKNTSLYIYGYQDKFRSLPGDDPQAASHVEGATVATAITAGDVGNGLINGKWDSTTPTHESYLFWQHVRLAGIATGITNTADTVNYPQRNTLGGLVGITNSTAADNPIYTSSTVLLKGAYIICSGNIQGKFAKQLDIMMDDGNTSSGSMMTQANNGGSPHPALTVGEAAIAAPVDDQLYNVCMGV